VGVGGRSVCGGGAAPAHTWRATGSTSAAPCSAACLWGMVTLKPTQSRSLKVPRKAAMSSTSSGTYTAFSPAARSAALWIAGLRLWLTGLPTMPSTAVSRRCAFSPYRELSCSRVGCPGAEARSGLSAPKVRKPPYLGASRRLIWPRSPMASAMHGTGQLRSTDSTRYASAGQGDRVRRGVCVRVCVWKGAGAGTGGPGRASACTRSGRGTEPVCAAAQGGSPAAAAHL
jgi:hypothetical protein